MIWIDPVTQQRVVYDKFCGDFTYDLVGDSAVAKETVPVVGTWADYTGSATVNSAAQQQWAGISNELEGEDAGVRGAKVGQLNEVGDNAQTTRRRVIKRMVVTNGNKPKVVGK